MEDDGFWRTMQLLVDRETGRRSRKEVLDDVQEWLSQVTHRNSLEEADHLEEAAAEEAAVDHHSSGYGSWPGDGLPDLKLPGIDCSFCHPQVRSRLEKLMGSNVVQLTDRKYMQKLRDRILEEYVEKLNKRIAEREAVEMEREKRLVLTGKIPLDEAPPEMSHHPVMIINERCKKIIAARRAQLKLPHIRKPKFLYVDDTPDPPSGLSIANRREKIRVPPETYLEYDDEEDIEREYMFDEDEMADLVYENDLITELNATETVEEMYAKADEIIGPLTMFGTGRGPAKEPSEQSSLGSALERLREEGETDQEEIESQDM